MDKIELDHMIATLRGRADDKLCLDAADAIEQLREEVDLMNGLAVKNMFEVARLKKPQASPRSAPLSPFDFW